MNQKRENEEIVIVGAGPAGITAACQLKRQGHDPLLLEAAEPGGLLKNAWRVENYPGFPAGISGSELVLFLQGHLERWKPRVSRERLEFLDSREGVFFLKTDQRELSAGTVILATGTNAKKPEWFSWEKEEELEGRLFFEVHHLLGVKGAEIIILGAGDAAFDYALNLAEQGNSVTILNRSERFRGLGLLFKQVEEHPEIRYLTNCVIGEPHLVEREGDSYLELGAAVEDIGIGSDIYFEADYMICALGREPELGFLASGSEKEMTRLLEEKRLFLVGDVGNGQFRQLGIAVGDGLRAAMELGDNFKL